MAPRTGDGLGVPERLLVTLPAPCIGHPLLGDVPCPAEGTFTLWGVIEKEDGSPMAVLATVCPKHVGAAQHWLESLTQGDPIERWATTTFFEHEEVARSSGLEWNRLMRIA